MTRGAAALAMLLFGVATARAQEDCPPTVDSLVDAAWQSYRAADLASADSLFGVVESRCPDHLGTRVGLGYIALRRGDTAEARSRFAAVLADRPQTIDALSGLGILAWRAGDLEAVRERFLAVLQLDPDNAEAQGYVERLPPGLRPAPRRPPLRLPRSVEFPARAHGDRLEVVRNGRWEPFYVKGVNLGAALPGRFPSEFPDARTYAAWVSSIAEMGANTVRVYTIHPPAFYQALWQHNRDHPESLLHLLQGVWTELPDGGRFDAPAWEGQFFGEMERAVDVVHGRADVPPRAGHASGSYLADVSRWTLGFIIGREWEPFAVQAFNRRRPEQTVFAGEYLTVDAGTPMDTWLARACDHLITYETATYRNQHPIAYTSWPTLDPLHHPTEATDAEEVVIRRRVGEAAQPDPKEFDNDAMALDPMVIRPTAANGAGFFAAYHAYPYYPDFMVLDSGYDTARSSLGRSNYFGYLRALKRHHRGMPVVIAEYGVPTGVGIAHLQNQGWHHGGHDESAMAAIDARLTREIAEAGMAGGIVFAWIDEWFKRNWLVADFELPTDRNALWLNRLDPEQQYGMIALEPEPPVEGTTPADRLTSWRSVPPLYHDSAGALRAATDESALWLLIEPQRPVEEVDIGVDLLHPDLGQFRWPDKAGPEIPVGLEMVIRVRGDTARVLVAPGANPWRVQRIASPKRGPPNVPNVAHAPPGFFAGRFALELQQPYATARHDGRYEPLLVLTNPRRFGRDGTEYAGLGYDRGVLPYGPPPFGAWERDSTTGAVEIRVPWGLLDVTDPSGHHVLEMPPLANGSGEGTGPAAVTIHGIRVVAAFEPAPGRWVSWPRSGSVGDVATYSWPSWEVPRWRSRRRPVFYALRDVFRALARKEAM